jgi:beta-galactosidase
VFLHHGATGTIQYQNAFLQCAEQKLAAFGGCRLHHIKVCSVGKTRTAAGVITRAAVAEKVIRTAGKPSAIRLTPDRDVLKADGEDICYLNVSIVDKDGNPVPDDNRLVNVKVSGAGSFRAIANGDPTCLESFQKPQMHLFSGQLTVLIQSGTEPGDITIEVSGKGVKKAIMTIKTE